MAIDERLAAKLANYKLPEDAKRLIKDTPIVLLVGISGAGKDTVKHELLATGHYHHIVSHTTRELRSNKGVPEQDGVDYHFIDLKAAEHMLDTGGFIEAKEYSHHVYGTSVGEIQLAHDEGKVATTDVEVQGVREYVLASDAVKAIFIMPPSYEIWQERLLKRYGNDHKDHSADILKRMQTAKNELEHLLKTDYFYLVVNRHLNETVTFIDNLALGKATNVVRQRDKDIVVVREILAKLSRELNG